ncbi:hypothetical protein VNI00_013360 [Paramarasmius palmivorus]|uniref:Uncharacterized protein n=1 Tax=Paramarasmius palmivorus TaxID=297713 RepID=A0AAW0C0X4_9AGAR
MSSDPSTTAPNSVTYYRVGFWSFMSVASYIGITKLWGRYRRTRDDNGERLQSQTEELREALQQKESDLAELREVLAVEREEVQSRQGALDRVTEEIERVRLQSEKQLAEARDRITRLAEALHTHANELSLAKEETRRLRLENEQLQSNVTLVEPDRIASTDVVRLVISLNGEICQTAELVASAFKSRFQELSGRPPEGESDDIREAVEYTRELLGERMTDMLRNVDHREDDSLLQIAFRASMCAYSEWVITSWAYRTRDEEQLIQDVYDRLREREEQPFSALWRILTRRYARQAFRNAPGADLSGYFLDAFSNVLVLAGLSEEESLDARLRQEFGGQVEGVINVAIQLNTAIGDSITSCELVPINCESGIPFEKNSMKNAFNGGPEELRVPWTDESVLCTTELGLLQSVKVNGRAGEWTHRMLLKPKVVLQSAFETASPVSDT